MNINQIRKVIERIEQIKDDDEAAHANEDNLRQVFIEYIAEKNGPYSRMAKEILKTEDIDFGRWCA